MNSLYFSPMQLNFRQLSKYAAIICMIWSMNGPSATAQEDLWIVRGTWTTFPNEVPALRLENDSNWTGINAVIARAADTASSITIHNTDSLDHLCALTWGNQFNTLIEAGYCCDDRTARFADRRASVWFNRHHRRTTWCL